MAPAGDVGRRRARAHGAASVVSRPVRPSHRAVPSAVLLAVLVAVPLTSCGNARRDPLARFKGRERAVAETVLAYGAAARRGDAVTVCRDLLAHGATKPLGNECPRRMRAALRTIGVQGLDVVNVRFKDGTAIATVVTGAGANPRSGSLALVPESGGWRIARVGPLPRPGADSG